MRLPPLTSTRAMWRRAVSWWIDVEVVTSESRLDDRPIGGTDQDDVLIVVNVVGRQRTGDGRLSLDGLQRSIGMQTGRRQRCRMAEF
jgi:hypothetical protein